MKVIHEHTEFGLDMIRGLPKAYYCTKNNIEHVCVVKPNLKELYSLVSNNIKEDARLTITNPDDIYRFEGPGFSKKEWLPPPLKDMFKDYLKFKKPTVVINNKCASDGSTKNIFNIAKKFNLKNDLEQILSLEEKSCVNYYSIPMLSRIFDLLSNKYQILYIRPISTNKKYVKDNSKEIPFNDFEFIEDNYPQVYTIKKFLEDPLCPTNNFTLAQFMFEATSDKHLSTIGGNCKISSYFGGDVIIYQWDGWKLGSPRGKRPIFDSNSWLKKLSNANIIGMHNYNTILNYIEKNWI